MADATDLKSVGPKGPCGFESRHRHSQFREERLPDLVWESFFTFFILRAETRDQFVLAARNDDSRLFVSIRIHSRFTPLKIRGFRIRTNPAILQIKRSDLCEILGIQGKIEYIEIFADARRRY